MNNYPYLGTAILLFSAMIVDLQQHNYHAVAWQLTTAAWALAAWCKDRRWHKRYGQSSSGLN